MSRSRTLLILCVIAVLAESLIRPQTSTAQAASSQSSDPRTACAADIQKLCAGVAPGGGRILACLKQNKDQVSDGCKRAILSAMGNAANPAPAAANPAPPTSNPAPATASPAPQAAPAAQYNDAGPASSVPSSSPGKSSLPGMQNSHASSTASAISGEHYFLMKRVQIIDNGLGQGKAAYDLMIPKDWQFQGAVKVGAAEGGCFGDNRPAHGLAQYVSLQLHAKAVGSDAPVDLQHFEARTDVLFHRQDNVASLVADGLQGRPCQVCLGARAGEPHYRPACVGAPVRSEQA